MSEMITSQLPVAVLRTFAGFSGACATVRSAGRGPGADTSLADAALEGSCL